MNNKYSIEGILQQVVSYRALPFPGVLFPARKSDYTADEFEYNGPECQVRTESELGSPLRKQGMLGQWYLMPITIDGIEIPNACVSLRCKKNIVDTSMVGRRGSVKELISIGDYDIDLVGVLIDEDYPDRQIGELKKLYTKNEAVKMVCALTDIFLDEDDRVVIKSLDLPMVKGVENAQAFQMSLVSDRDFELVIE